MKNCLDYEKIRHILEKAEKGEALDKIEKSYLDIIKVLQAEKNNKVEINEKFQENLKNELLIKFDNLYKKKGLYYKMLSMMDFPLFRFAVSFCFIFSISFGIYSNLNFNYKSNLDVEGNTEFNSKSINSELIPTRDNSDKITPEASSEKESKKMESPSLKSVQDIQMNKNSIDKSDSAQFSAEPSSGIQFKGSNNGIMDNTVKGSSEENLISRYLDLIEKNKSTIFIILFSIIISSIIAFKRKKNIK